MKNFLIMILAFLLAVVFIGCDKKPESDSKNVYQIMQKNESKEKVEEYFNDWYKNVTKIEDWTNLLNK